MIVEKKYSKTNLRKFAAEVASQIWPHLIQQMASFIERTPKRILEPQVIAEICTCHKFKGLFPP